jgi:hypothetical protein
MKLPKQGLALFRRLRKCERECVQVKGEPHAENPAWVLCEKHQVYRLCL